MADSLVWRPREPERDLSACRLRSDGAHRSRGVQPPRGALLGGLGAFILAEVFAQGSGYAKTSRAPSDMPPDSSGHRIVVHLDRLLAEREMTLTELAERVDVTVVNLSILKNGRARAVRFSTLTALCDALGCQPSDVLSYEDAAGRE